MIADRGSHIADCGLRTKREGQMRFVRALAVSVVCAAVLVAAANARPAAAGVPLTIVTLSSRADLVSGGDVLVEIKTAAGAPANVSVTVNSRDVRRAFHVDADRRSLVGLVDGLAIGRNTIVAKAGSETARLDVTNYPITGPILSGGHLKPFVCHTVQSGLGEPLDADCSAKTKIDYFYKSTEAPTATGRGAQGAPGAAFKPFDLSAPRPADMAQTTTSGRPDGPLHRPRRVRHD